jgi:glycogen operon protein
MLFNAHHEPIDFTLPSEEFGGSWQVVLDTSVGVADETPEPAAAGSTLTVDARSTVVLQALVEDAS